MADIDDILAWRMFFGDPKHGWPLDSREYNAYCARQDKGANTKDIEAELYNSLYPDNDIVKKVGDVFAEEGQSFIRKFCHESMYSTGAAISRRGYSAIMGARMSKNARDTFTEMLMYISKHTRESSLETLLCLLNNWASTTEGMYPEEHDIREIIKDYLTGAFQKIVSIVEKEKKMQKEPKCELGPMGIVNEKPKKSIQLLVLKALNSLTKK